MAFGWWLIGFLVVLLLYYSSSSRSSRSAVVVTVTALPFRGGGTRQRDDSESQNEDIEMMEAAVDVDATAAHIHVVHVKDTDTTDTNPQQQKQTHYLNHQRRRRTTRRNRILDLWLEATTLLHRHPKNDTHNNIIIIEDTNENHDPHDSNVQHMHDFHFDWNSSESHLLTQEIRNLARNLTDYLIATRRSLHQIPELMYQEQHTSAFIQHALLDMGVSTFTTGWAINTHPFEHGGGPGGYGIVADLGTGEPPCILLRADIDALPIHERTTDVDAFKSRNDGLMHACGHDGHTTMLLGATKLLKNMEASLPGTVRIMFQPAEEGGAGGKRMIEEGVLHQPPAPVYGFALHVWPTLPTGVIASRPGPLLAACERFEILVAGVGGHAAMPHLTIDPIVTASAMVMTLQTVVSRFVSPLEAGVVSITQFDAGPSGAFNIIPASAVLRGTIRSLSTDTLLQLRRRVEEIVLGTAATYGCNVTMSYAPDYYPPTVNDPVLFESFSQHVAALVSDEGVVRRDIDPTMGAEDFSFIAANIPSTFFLLGQGSGEHPPSNFGLHHPHFAMDESVLSRGVELHVNVAVRALHYYNTMMNMTQQQQQ